MVRYNTCAHFSGATTSYSRYFQDYQQFVERPNMLARRVEFETRMRMSSSSNWTSVFSTTMSISTFWSGSSERAIWRTRSNSLRCWLLLASFGLACRRY